MVNSTIENGVKTVKGYLKTVEVAERFDVNPRTILRWVKAGYFPGSLKKNPFAINSPVVIPEEAVEEFAKAQLIEPENSANDN